MLIQLFSIQLNVESLTQILKGLQKKNDNIALLTPHHCNSYDSFLTTLKRNIDNWKIARIHEKVEGKLQEKGENDLKLV